MDAVLEDWTTADVSDRLRAALGLVEIMTRRPLEIDTEFVEGLRSQGLDDFAIREAGNVGFHYNYINRVVDAFDYPVPRGKQAIRLARLLNIAGKIIKGVTADPVWVRSEDDGIIRPTEVENGRQRMLTADGYTEESLRRSVEGYVKQIQGYEKASPHEIPPELKPFFEKLALHAYRITDSDIDDLKAAGYTEDMIYELVIVGCLGTALVALENLFEAMYGDITH